MPPASIRRAKWDPPQPEATDRVQQQPHFHSSLGGGHEAIEHGIAAGIVSPDVKLDVNMIPRVIDTLGQGRIKFRAIDEEPRFFRTGNGILVDL